MWRVVSGSGARLSAGCWTEGCRGAALPDCGVPVDAGAAPSPTETPIFGRGTGAVTWVSEGLACLVYESAGEGFFLDLG